MLPGDGTKELLKDKNKLVYLVRSTSDRERLGVTEHCSRVLSFEGAYDMKIYNNSLRLKNLQRKRKRVKKYNRTCELIRKGIIQVR
jgi:hypothetical protein